MYTHIPETSELYLCCSIQEVNNYTISYLCINNEINTRWKTFYSKSFICIPLICPFQEYFLNEDGLIQPRGNLKGQGWKEGLKTPKRSDQCTHKEWTNKNVSTRQIVQIRWFSWMVFGLVSSFGLVFRI